MAGLPDPDWHLMDPVTGEDIEAFARLSAAVAARDLADPERAPWREIY